MTIAESPSGADPDAGSTRSANEVLIGTPFTPLPGRSGGGLQFGFYGRCSTEDQQDPESSRQWQLNRARALIGSHDGVIVAEYFDIGQSRSLPWSRRPEASALLAELRNPDRGFDAVVIGEPQRAFYGNQYGLTFPLFVNFDVTLWVPEVGGRIDPNNEAHDLVMSVFGGLSKGERNRIKIRVRTAMMALAQIEGRFLGGRPPYGYRLVDIGPHPNPAKAAEGKRLHALELDPYAATVVQRIFTEFLLGRGLFAIAEGLTRDGILSPSAHDPDRNRHRSGIAWSKGAVRAIITNPRYTGRQVWNRQRKDEVLLDIDDVALGHITKQRWNTTDKWIISEQIVHPTIIDDATFRQVQEILAARGHGSEPHERTRTRHTYVLRGRFICGLCDRKMQAHWTNDRAYYRCRYPNEYGLANRVEHPRNIFVRENDVLPQLDGWLAKAFAPHHIEATIDEMLAVQVDFDQDAATTHAHQQISECAAKMARYRAALDAGGDIEEITSWINHAKAERVQAEAALRDATGRTRMTKEEIRTIVDSFTSITAVLRDADPADKAQIYQQLGLQLRYDPGKQIVRAEASLDPHYRGVMVGVRGGT
jgi:site-specific DNA recombinase